MITKSIAELRSGWWSFALPGYRDHPELTTYSLFPYERLPEIEVPDDTGWDWLESQAPHEEWSLSDNSDPDGSGRDLSHLRPLIGRVPFEIPEAFTTFLETPSLHSRIRSCTACRLELGDFPVYTTNPPDGVILLFLIDQQGVLLWYFFADSLGNQAVLVSSEIYGFGYSPEETPRNNINLFEEDIWLCAPSFRKFIYRFWLENEVWFTLTEGGKPLTSQQRDYLNHYR